MTVDSGNEPYNAADPAMVTAAKTKAKNKSQRLGNQTKTVMASAEGRAWMWDLLSTCHVFHTPFAKGDSHATSFACGEQNVGLKVMAGIMAECPELYLIMQKEQLDD